MALKFELKYETLIKSTVVHLNICSRIKFKSVSGVDVVIATM